MQPDRNEETRAAAASAAQMRAESARRRAEAARHAAENAATD